MHDVALCFRVGDVVDDDVGVVDNVNVGDVRADRSSPIFLPFHSGLKLQYKCN